MIFENVAKQIRYTASERLDILLAERRAVKPAVQLERADGRNYNDGIGHKRCGTALNIEKFFCAEIGTEARLGNGIIA